MQLCAGAFRANRQLPLMHKILEQFFISGTTNLIKWFASGQCQSCAAWTAKFSAQQILYIGVFFQTRRTTLIFMRKGLDILWF